MVGSLTGAYYSAVSADGLNWSGPAKPFQNSQDNITLTQDPNTGEYLAYLRFHRRAESLADYGL